MISQQRQSVVAHGEVFQICSADVYDEQDQIGHTQAWLNKPYDDTPQNSQLHI